MKQKINISETENGTYEVTVTAAGDGQSTYRVKIDDAYLEELGVRADRQESIAWLLQATFEFLLNREPKEAIMAEFELPVVEHFFPEYRAWIASKAEEETL